jgi:hypothetical protein
MIFELTKPTTALLASVTNRAENHGEDKVPAVSLGLTIQASTSVLDMLCPQLVPLLGVDSLEGVALATVCEGWTMHVEHGIEADDGAITLGGCRLDKFRVAPGNDGMCELRLRVASHDLTPMTLGLLGMKAQQEIVITVIAPKLAMQTNSNAQAKAMKEQRELENAGQRRVDAPGAEPDTPERALERGVKARRIALLTPTGPNP